MLVKEPLVAVDAERLDLGLGRSAVRARIDLAGGASVTVAVTHLHHLTPHEAERDEQARLLIDWLDGAPPADAVIVVGDFNAEPDEATYTRMRSAGFRSAYSEANGTEPAVTWPSGLTGPAIDTDGPPGCLDYIWVRGTATVDDCRLVFDRPAVVDPGLYPSDHLGLAAHLSVG